MLESEKRNREVLASNADMFDQYEFIPKILRHTHWFKFSDIKMEGNCLYINDNVSRRMIEFSWSYNEPKMYFSAGPLQIRLDGTEEALEAALKAIEIVKPVFDALVAHHEL